MKAYNLLESFHLTTMNDIANMAKLKLACHFKIYLHEVYDKTTYYNKKRFFRHIIIGPVSIKVNYGIRFIAIEYNNYTYAMHIELEQFKNDFITIDALFKRLTIFINTIEDLPF